MKVNLGSSHHTSWGPYPERLESQPSWFDRAGKLLSSPVLRFARLHALRKRPFVNAVSSHGKWAASLSDGKLREEAAELGFLLREQGFTNPLVARCFSLIREA